MFAFAIWDARQQRLVMIRDRMGVKPLYFYRTPDGVLFGSEPKAILANPLAERVVDIDGLREMMSYVQTPGHAIWRGMTQVRPGTIVTVDERGIRERTYWRLDSRLHSDDQQRTVSHVRELLDDIIRRQLVSDVPQCVLLSGGLDSSTITALSARMLDAPVRSFAVDFAGQAENFQPNEVWPSQDAPYVHEVAKHVGADHTDIVLDHATLADPEIRRQVVAARDTPAGVGNMDLSMYLLFKSIRVQSTVALSGESADEIFGGYREFHDPEVQQSDMFPWHVKPDSLTRTDIWLPTPDLGKALDLETYQADRYREAVAEVARVPEEDDFTHRMRVMSYLHLTRFVQFLLHRKDRLSMAVGLEVRVPFCDHRLVEYVYNTPWSLKNYDGREKSLLRGAALDVLPASVARRVKSPYPTTQDPQYGTAIQQQAKDLLVSGGDELFSLIDRAQLQQATEWDAVTLPSTARRGMETALEIAEWLDLYKPTMAI
jgi:asparagine synthase (glutamine-hydrolysing)